MAKHVFKPTEITNLTKKVYIEPPNIEIETEVEVAPVEEDTRQTLDDLTREKEEFLGNWIKEKSDMIEQARAEAEKIIKEAEELAFAEVQKKSNQAQKFRQEAADEAKKVLDDANKKAADLEAEVNARIDKVEKEAFDRGFREGHEQGFKSGSDEVKRLVERLQLIITRAIERRNAIIEESETQLINLVLLIANKVIKVISENQKNVVINNVIQALRKLKGRGDVIIRVNLSDIELVSTSKQFLQEQVENVNNITVLEDSSVDKGGCIIETDFGQIDARISSQLNELEEKIMEMMPIRAKSEP
ncbi:MAG: flagellar assembly protein FliH [Spirochaetales bacterium]|nr:flagellar assembly protein FliH [Spirochaetales bacterium]